MVNWKEVISNPKVEGVRGGARLNLRSEGEIEVIGECALYLCKGDVLKAKRLLLKTQFLLYGRVWGESLFVGDADQPLVELAEIILTLELSNLETEDNWRRELVGRTLQEVLRRPYELPLNLAMLADLGGDLAVAMFKAAVGRQDAIVIPEEDFLEVEGARDFYLRLRGRSYWKMDEKVFRGVFLTSFSAWRRAMEGAEEMGLLIEEGQKVDFDENERMIMNILSPLRVQLRRLARVAVGRDLIPKTIRRGFFKFEGNEEKLDYGQVLEFLD